MVSTPLTTPQIRTTKRTLCIGIGGTGRDTLMRLRRFIIEHHGKLANLPVVSFLAIDTDEGCLKETGLNSKTHRGEQLVFDPNEKVAITMNDQAVGQLVTNFRHKSYGDSPFSHIEDWFPPALKEEIKVISGGANGVRPIGRLGFFHNFQIIKQAIQDAVIRTVGHEQKMLSQNYRVDEGLDVVVVGSLCGGTGSGIFLDIAYTLRYLFQNDTTTLGYLVISPDLYPNHNMMQAGIYAALKELNYYTSDGTKFEACYDKNNQIFVSESRPPFDYTYLMSSQTSSNHQITRKEDLCNVIAYKIYLDIASEVRIKLKANRVNINPRMLEKDLHPFRMSQYYMTFGLSAICFSRDRLLSITYNRLTIKLLEFWLEGYGQAPDARDLLDRFLGKLDAAGQSEIFTTRLSELTQEQGKTYSQYLTNWKNKNQDNELNDDEGVEDLKQSLPNRFKSAFREVQPGRTDAIRGKWLTLVKNNRPKVLEELQRTLDAFLNDLLNPNNENFSVYNALSFLEAIRTKLDQYQYNLEDKKQDMGGMKTQEEIESIWLEADQETKEVKSKGWLPWAKKRDYPSIQSILDNAIEQVSKLFKHNYDLFTLGEAIGIVESLKEYVAQRLNQVTNLDTLLRRLLHSYQQQQEKLKTLPTEEIPGEAIFPEEEIDQLIPFNSSRDKLVQNSNETIQELNYSLFELAANNNFVEELVKNALKIALDRNFIMQDTTQMQSVVKRFMASYNTEQQAIALENIVGKSAPLLDIFRRDPLFMGGVESFAAAFKVADDADHDPFRKILTEQLGIPAIAINPIQADSEILFIKEYGGFPLRLINHLKQLKQVYDHQKKDGKLHNHAYIQFDDILPVDARVIENLEYLLYPCLAFKILSCPKANSNQIVNIFDNSTGDDCYEFTCFDSLRNEYYVAELSTDWRTALEQLVERKDMIDILSQSLKEEENKIKANPSLLDTMYKPRIVDFINQVDRLQEGDRNFIHKAKVIGQRATANTPANEGIITRYLKRLEDEINAERQRINNVLPSSNQTNQGSLPQATNDEAK